MHTIRRTLTEAALLVALALLAARGGAAQSFYTLYSFKGTTDGSAPNGVIFGKNGALYGTTYGGGNQNGTVFELTPVKGAAWNKTVLFNFNGTDGSGPSAELIGPGAPGPSLAFGSNGALYGATVYGGSGNGGGTVFELAPPATSGGAWTETVLYSLPGGPNAPRAPIGRVFIGPSGALYGTASLSAFPGGITGYPAGGTVFKLTPPATPGGSWTESTLLSLWPETPMGFRPQAGVVSAGGSLYGTTYDPEGCGVVYELSPPVAASEAWTGTAIFGFGGSDGCSPLAPVTVGPGGVFYGTTASGGASTTCLFGASLGCGTVFQLTPPATAGGAWTETVIYSFTALNGDGAYPVAGVVLGKGGVLYGTTTYGGAATSGSPCIFSGTTPGCGTVFKLTPPATPGGSWTETILHSFTGQDGEGAVPGPLVLNADGVLFGPTWSGGAAGQGTIFAVAP